MKQYELIEKRRIEELRTDMVVYRHRKSGARILTMQNEDVNKVFSIAFRTPAADSTGVAHITEHSVLCGSEKFPLKDPFVELAKGSLNTFLNAMTYPDKTVYPIASTNDKDFDNLMDVYMDAVLHPNCIKNEWTFRQEGWHYELDTPDGELSYNGVVYNEMKGAFSNPESVLERYILHALYPDNTYANESGGDPEVIPTLSYQDFCAFHARYYHPSNAYIILYGNMDMEKKLAWLDEAYLSAYDAINPDSEIPRQEAFADMHEEEMVYPIGEHETLKNRTYLSYNLSVRDDLDPKLCMAFDVLDYALISGPGAPLRQAILDAGIGEDVFGGYEDGILQPYFSITAKNAEAWDKDHFLKIIRDTLAKLVRDGLDQKTLLAAINRDEFQYREADYGRTPKGLVYALTVMDAWLYDGKPWTHLECEHIYKELRDGVSQGYFESLIEKYLLHNTHAALVTLKPEQGLTEKRELELKEKLRRYKESLSAAEISELVRNTHEMKRYQDTPTPEEDLQKLPLLTREDIRKEADQINYTVGELYGSKVLFTELDSRGIAYLRFNFNTSGLTEEELPYAGFLKTVFGYMDTKNHTYQDLSSDVLLHTGGIQFDANAYPDLHHYNYYTGIFSVDIRLLYPEIPYGLKIIDEILHTTKFGDRKRMKEILNEARSRERMRIEGSGHTYAVNRSTSYFSGTARYQDLTGGIEYYRFIVDAVERFDRDPEGFTEKLSEVAEKIVSIDNLFVSIGAEQTGYKAFCREFAAFRDCFRRNDREGSLMREILNLPKVSGAREQDPQIQLSGNRNEGFRTPSQINYVARTGWYDPAKHPYTGALKVLKNILNFEYLWSNLRVKGGAYGCMAGFGRSGETYFVSYRDPNLRETLKIYEKIPAYLADFRCSDRDMTKYVIGAISELDTPKTNYTQALLSVSAFLSGVTNEMLQQEREEVLSATVEDIRNLAPYAAEALAVGAGCTIGGAAMVDAAKDCFYTIEDLFQ